MKVRLVAYLVVLVTSLTMAAGLVVPMANAQESPQEQINSGLCAGADLQFTADPASVDCDTTGAVSSIDNVIRNFVNLLSAIVGIVAVIMIIIGGLRYIISGGNDTSVTGAKNTILYAIVGLVVVALAQVIVRFTLNRATSA